MITDTNVYLSRWPFRRLPGDEPAELVAKLRKQNVTEAWAGSFDALLHEDIAQANARLAHDCREFGRGLLIPFGTVNLRMPDWKEDVRRCQEEHRMPGIRLHPNYQCYQLTHPAFAELLEMAAERRMIVQIAVAMEDERTQHPLIKVPDLDLTPMPALLKACPVRLQFLSVRRIPAAMVKALAAVGEVYFDFSFIEGVWGLSRMFETAPERIAFGSYSPYLYFESVYLKLRETALTEQQSAAVLRGNAARLRRTAGT